MKNEHMAWAIVSGNNVGYSMDFRHITSLFETRRSAREHLNKVKRLNPKARVVRVRVTVEVV